MCWRDGLVGPDVSIPRGHHPRISAWSECLPARHRLCYTLGPSLKNNLATHVTWSSVPAWFISLGEYDMYSWNSILLFYSYLGDNLHHKNSQNQTKRHFLLNINFNIFKRQVLYNIHHTASFLVRQVYRDREIASILFKASFSFMAIKRLKFHKTRQRQEDDSPKNRCGFLALGWSLIRGGSDWFMILRQRRDWQAARSNAG